MNESRIRRSALRKWLTITSLCCSPALAQWAQEPTAVFGIELGKPHTQPACGPAYFAGPQCVRASFSPDYASIENTPKLPFDYMASLSMYNGSVSSVALTGKNNEWPSVKETLTQRYGKPASVDVSTVKSGAGATFTSETLAWAGAEVTIAAIQRSGRVDEWLAVIQHNQTESARQAAKAARDKTSSGGL